MRNGFGTPHVALYNTKQKTFADHYYVDFHDLQQHSLLPNGKTVFIGQCNIYILNPDGKKICIIKRGTDPSRCAPVKPLLAVELSENKLGLLDHQGLTIATLGCDGDPNPTMSAPLENILSIAGATKNDSRISLLEYDGDDVVFKSFTSEAALTLAEPSITKKLPERLHSCLLRESREERRVRMSHDTIVYPEPFGSIILYNLCTDEEQRISGVKNPRFLSPLKLAVQYAYSQNQAFVGPG